MKDELTPEDITLIFNRLRDEVRKINIEKRKERMLESIELSFGVIEHKRETSYDYSPRYRSPVIKAENVGLLPVRAYPKRSNVIRAGTYVMGREPVVIGGL